MTQGETTKQQIDRDYPFQVELTVPILGFGARLDAMNLHAGILGYQTRASGERDRDAVRWCFRERAHAEQFQRAFGGELFSLY